MGLDSFSFFLLLTVSGLRFVCTLRGCGGGEGYCLVLELLGVYVGVVIGVLAYPRGCGRCGEY